MAGNTGLLKTIIKEIEFEALHSKGTGPEQREGMGRAIAIIRKHLGAEENNGWIPADSPPPDGQEVWVVLEHTYPSDYREYGIARYINVEGERHWCAAHHGYLEWEKYSDGHGGCSLYRVAAWQPVRPYRPGGARKTSLTSDGRNKGYIIVDDVPVICAECDRAEIRGDKLYCTEKQRLVYNAKPDWCPVHVMPGE